MENTVTIVTCYYKIPSKRTHDTYDMYIKNFLGNLSTHCFLIIFTSQDLVSYLKSYLNENIINNIFFIIKEFEDIEINKKYKHIWENQYMIDSQKNIRTKECYIIWNSKLNFVKESIEKNPFNSNKFIWLDIGCIRENFYTNFLQNFPKYENISSNKVDVVLIENFNNLEQQFFQDEIHLGGLFGSSATKLLEFHKLFYEYFDIYLNNNRFIGCDQQIISSVYIANKDLFNIINPYQDNINENNKLIIYKQIDPWFYFLHYYSY